MPKLAIIGAGLIGRAWSMVFARAGWDIALWDGVAGAADSAKSLIAQGLVDLARHGLAADPAGAAARVAIRGSLEEAVAGADLVQESTPETLDMKREVFARLDAAAAPGTILASSTSSLVTSLYTEDLAGRSRCLVAHPVNPPHLVPIVELCGAPWTCPEVMERARRIYSAVGQVPIHVKREVDGFVLNRLQTALLAEAFRLVEEGVVSPQDLDETIRNGLGLRWSFMGPFETIELNAPGGIPDYCARYSPFFRRLAHDQPKESVWEDGNTAAAAAAWGPTPDPRRHAAKTRWRDEQLAALAAHKRKIQPFSD
ncbi:MAG: 3-hydroxyacyl-CoA dehydrogenase [Hyphomicrobiaceae bacterium]|nr:3-hydroxyacyl-CoA dehydrogenase [Hyphomicrobiaceae bacterium]